MYLASALEAGEIHVKTSPISSVIDLIISCSGKLGFGTLACVLNLQLKRQVGI